MKKIITLLKKPFAFAVFFGVLLMLCNGYVLLKTFCLPSVTGYVANSNQETTGNSQGTSITDSSYEDENISIQITTMREYDTDIYIADITLSSADYLKTALANNMVGTNITQKTSQIAQSNNAILAINGDYYGANHRGYVIKNGELYRDTVRKDGEYQDLVIYEDGSFDLIYEEDISAQELLENGVVNLFAFGPGLIENGKIVISEGEEVGKAMSDNPRTAILHIHSVCPFHGKAMSDNPRTAIGIIDKLHYVMVVSDGRTSKSEGLSLYEMALILQDYGCQIAYNLDGGGSSTMYFNGEIINNPTTNGRKISERSVSDIVYIGY